MTASINSPSNVLTNIIKVMGITYILKTNTVSFVSNGIGKAVVYNELINCNTNEVRKLETVVNL